MIENREQQIKSASEIIAYGCSDELKAALIQDFPELAESEDERIRKLLVWQVHRNIEDETNDLAQSVYDGIKGHDPDIEESIEDWKKCLAYLEKQKAQQPAEWSEEDEKICKGLKELIPQCMTAQGYNRYYNWLKNLHNRIHPKPHWKPSEEQMQALKHAYSMMNGQAGTDLANLYYDLKKLM